MYRRCGRVCPVWGKNGKVYISVTQPYLALWFMSSYATYHTIDVHISIHLCEYISICIYHAIFVLTMLPIS
jgi:hypothetical protein